MDYFGYRKGQLYAEDVSITSIAEDYGTPAYVYSRATLERHWHAFDQAFGEQPHLVCYAVKANSNLAILNLLARLGSGFDIVSVGELERVLKAGGSPKKVVFSGVGKRAEEIARALEVGIRCFNVESASELERINRVAGETGYHAPISLRVNPDVDAKTHPYISTGLKKNKFGIDVETARSLYRHADMLPHIDVRGIDCHIGSQLTEMAPFMDALDRILLLLDQLEADGLVIEHLDLGGGLGVRYLNEDPPSPAEYAQAICSRLANSSYEILIEPGRAIMANAGILISRVEYLKQTQDRNFAIIDAAMNDLLRPALYQAEQNIITVKEHPKEGLESYDIVGPICETGDFLGKGRRLSLHQSALIAIRGSGAYGFSMASNYNSRPRPPEILVDGSQVHLIRQRESIEDLYRGETLLPD